MQRFTELCRKWAIKVDDGSCIGRIGDIEIENGRIKALVIPGRMRFFGLLGREPERVIPWEFVKITGKDVILIRFS